jgi:hypothetical protein
LNTAIPNIGGDLAIVKGKVIEINDTTNATAIAIQTISATIDKANTNCFTNSKVDFNFGDYTVDENVRTVGFGVECKFAQCVNVRCLEIVYTSSEYICQLGCPNVETIISTNNAQTIGTAFCTEGCDNVKTISTASYSYGDDFCKRGCDSM